MLAELAQKLGKPIDVETPAKVFQSVFDQHVVKQDWSGAQEFVHYSERQGGWWFERESAAAAPKSTPAKLAPLQEAEFEGNAEQFPLQFQPYPSVQFGDGSGANLPWMQQLPDPASSAMWGLPVEVDPRTADQLGVRNGDTVRVTSPAGQIEAPVYVHPAAIPGVVSMAIGQGHAHYGRYASGRGSNPLAIVAAANRDGNGVPAFGATRIRLEKVANSQRLVQFAYMDRDEHQHRP